MLRWSYPIGKTFFRGLVGTWEEEDLKSIHADRKEFSLSLSKRWPSRWRWWWTTKQQVVNYFVVIFLTTKHLVVHQNYRHGGVVTMINDELFRFYYAYFEKNSGIFVWIGWEFHPILCNNSGDDELYYF